MNKMGLQWLAIFCLFSFGLAQYSYLDGSKVILHNRKLDTKTATSYHLDEAHLERTSRDSIEVEHQFLVHVGKALNAAEKNSLESSLNVKLDVYIPHNTYLVVSTKSVADLARQNSLVKWVGDFAPEYKYQSDLIENLQTSKKLNVVLAPKERTISHAQNIAANWNSLLEVKSVVAISSDRIVVTLKNSNQASSVVSIIADQPESHYLESVSTYESYNAFASTVIQSNSKPALPNPMYQVGLNGQNQVVGLADTGVAYTSCFFSNATSTAPTNTLNANAKIVRYISTYGDTTDSNGHGTAVAGTILGLNGTSISNGITPNAKLHFTDIQSGNGALTPPTNLGDLFTAPYADGVRLFVAPFGAAANAYGTDAQAIDKFTYTNPNFLIITPAGNYNRSLSSLAYSKNALVVGGSMSSNDGVRNGLPAQDQLYIVEHPALFGSHVLANFSSRGPTSDGRMKPDIVAPALSLMTASTATCRASSVKGTSYAAGVAAAAAVFTRNYFDLGFYPNGEAGGSDPQYTDPPASVVKAILINSGQPLTLTDENGKGNYVSLEYPSPLQGFGRIQLDQTLITKNASAVGKDLYVYPGEGLNLALSTSQSARFCFRTINNGALKATLVWTDKDASPTAGHILVNDLDLVVIDETGVVTRTQTNGGEFDSFNNVEQVQVRTHQGYYAVIVHGRNVPVGPQSYALVITGDIDYADCFTDFPGGDVCPNDCSGFGNCVGGSCNCTRNHEGVDCSLSPCPVVSGNICSGNGYCDYSTSTCVCGGAYSSADCSVIAPPPTVANDTATTIIFNSPKSPYTAGLLAGTVVAAFFLGAIFSVFLGGYLAVRYLEYRRDKAMRDRSTKDEEMN